MAAQYEPKLNRRLVKVKAAADYLTISKRKLWGLSQNGIIPVVGLPASFKAAKRYSKKIETYKF